MSAFRTTSGGLVDIVREVFEIPVRGEGAVLSRLRRLLHKDWPEPRGGNRGRPASFSLRAVIDTCIAFALVDAGFDVDDAAAVCSAADGRRGLLARRTGSARGSRGTLLVVVPRGLDALGRKRAGIPVMRIGTAADVAGSFDLRAVVVIDAGRLGERVTRAIVDVGECDAARLEVAFADL